MYYVVELTFENGDVRYASEHDGHISGTLETDEPQSSSLMPLTWAENVARHWSEKGRKDRFNKSTIKYVDICEASIEIGITEQLYKVG